MNHCHHDDDDNYSSLRTTIHIYEREHIGEPAWKCIDSAKAPIDMLWV
jgi:glutathionylspermidine synthase